MEEVKHTEKMFPKFKLQFLARIPDQYAVKSRVELFQLQKVLERI
jgi:hypothetical protein